MTKPFSLDEFSSRVRSLLRRCPKSQADSAGLIQVGNLVVNTNKRQVYQNSERILLTYLEFTILAHLASCPGEPISRQELLQKVWGYSEEATVETRVVDVNISRLRQKLKVNSGETELIDSIRGVGYVLNYDPSHSLLAREAS